jgi:hypothetical protein
MDRVSKKLTTVAAVVAGLVVGVRSSHASKLLEDTFQIPSADNSGSGYNDTDTSSPTGWYGFGDDTNSVTYSQYPANPSFYYAQLGPWGQGDPAGFTNTTPTRSSPSTLDPASPTLPGTIYWAGIDYNQFLFTTKAGVAGAGINTSQLTSASFQVNTFDTSDSLTAVLQVDGTWYYSQNAVADGTTLGYNNTSWQTDTFSASGLWAPLTVHLGTDTGGSSALGSGVFGALPSGTITGLGVYQAGIPGAGGGYDISDYVLNGNVPEPGTLSLLALGAMGLMARRRKA